MGAAPQFLAVSAGSRALRRAAAVGLAAAVVALSAQVAVPVPFSPVPMTLQPLAVLVVGALLGPAAGCAALVTYLIAGVAGLPVFAAGGSGVARLVGPTGGYLLAFPVAAAVTGWIAGAARREPRLLRLVAGCAAGIGAIHLGGTAYLAVLGGDTDVATRVGLVPFITGDLLKIGLAAGIVLLAGRRVRSLL